MADGEHSCPKCGATWTDREDPGVLCRFCYERMPGAAPPAERVLWPGFTMWRAWLEPVTRARGRRFGVALVLEDVAKNPTTSEGTLDLGITGTTRPVDIRVTTAVKRSDFVDRWWDLPTWRVQAPTLVYVHPDPVLPRDPPYCEVVAKLAAADGATYEAAWTEYWIGQPPREKPQD